MWHRLRFKREDNVQARHFFATAVRLDPSFARPHAGLSFTHFQDAFQGWSERTVAEQRAYRAAAEGLMADDRDPGAHWASGGACPRCDAGTAAANASRSMHPLADCVQPGVVADRDQVVVGADQPSLLELAQLLVYALARDTEDRAQFVLR